MSERQPSPIENSENDTSFETEFAHKETYVINDANVESVDIRPEHPKTEVPVLVAPGYAGTVESFKPGIKVLVESGRRTISLSHPRRGGTIPNLEDKETRGYAAEELRKANSILGLLEQKGIEKTDVIAHSEGAINICIAAMLHPEKFRNIVLYAPAGLIGNDNLLRLIKGVLTHPKRPKSMDDIPVTEAETELLKSMAHIGAEYQKENPVRAVKEILAISQAQIQEMLKYLHEKGIGIVIIAAVDDTFFPMGTEGSEGENEKRTYQKNVKPDFIDGFLSVKGGHMQIQIHPELYMGTAESSLTALEEKERKEKAV